MAKSNIVSRNTVYSDRANPRRGYHDYVTTLTFDGGTEKEQLAEAEEVRTEIAKESMWAYPPTIGNQPNIWHIYHGYDSGD